MISEEILREHLEKKKMQLIQEFPTKIEIDKIKIIEHTKRVVKLCEEFATELDEQGIEVDRQLLIRAAWLHDIAKFDDGDDHHKKKNVKAVLEKYDMDIESDLVKSIAKIISEHKGSFEPKKHRKEAAILRICDKLDKFNKGKDDAEEKCNKSIEKISEWAEEEEWFTDFNEIYLAMREDIKADVLKNK